MSWGSFWSQLFCRGNMEVNTVQSIMDQPVHTEDEMSGIYSSEPLTSATNVINHDPNADSLTNMLNYAKSNNSASAYENYLNNAFMSELSSNAISRAIQDAEANGISKYQLFQSGNAAASAPSSAAGASESYEKAMERNSKWNINSLKILSNVLSSVLGSAMKLMK